ncbi:Chromo-like domain superfamily [Sesbania bispinosa]|nr:Chromo-like domain superfamily [Sesbania bispinosa]
MEPTPMLTPLKILGCRTIAGRQGSLDQVLVQWDTQSEHEATWEDRAEITRSYPLLDLEDKVVLHGRDNDMSPTFNKANDVAAESNNQNIRPRRTTTEPRWLRDYQH